jgi:5-methyltetrahydropteroyltriglutamate--homocysteine methyltransferase
MLDATRDLVLPTTITGSYPRPQWFTQELRGRGFKDAMGDSRFREQYLDAVACLVREQEMAGLDIVTDGDARFDLTVGGKSWFFYVIERLRGVTGHVDRSAAGGWRGLPAGHILREVMEAYQPAVIGEAIGAGPLQYAALFKTAQRLSARPVKFGAITAQSLAKMLVNRHYASDRDLILALADVFNAELKEVAAAGCRVIQVEEPQHHIAGANGTATDKDLEFFTEAVNREIAGVGTEVWLHTCWGNPNQQPLHWERPSYERSLPYLLQTHADVLTLECASTNGRDLPLLGGPHRQEDRHRRRESLDGRRGAAGVRRQPHPPGAGVRAAGTAHPLDRLRLRPRRPGPAHRLLQGRGHQPWRQHRAPRAEAPRGGDRRRRPPLDIRGMSPRPRQGD